MMYDVCADASTYIFSRFRCKSSTKIVANHEYLFEKIINKILDYCNANQSLQPRLTTSPRSCVFLVNGSTHVQSSLSTHPPSSPKFSSNTVPFGQLHPEMHFELCTHVASSPPDNAWQVGSQTLAHSEYSRPFLHWLIMLSETKACRFIRATFSLLT